MGSSSVVDINSEVEVIYNTYLEKIRKEINNAAENWFHIAYYVYELKFFEYYKPKYDNIVDCCQAEFGFKKSTTYNFINIVVQFVNPKQCSYNTVSYQSNTYVGYNEFMNRVKGWSYSQLVSMLSLSEKERALATPGMSSREIKLLKTNSKRLEKSNPDVFVEPVESAPAPSDETTELSKRLELVQSEYEQANDMFLSELSTNNRLQEQITSLTAQLDSAVETVQKLKADIKQLKAENKRLKAQLKD